MERPIDKTKELTTPKEPYIPNSEPPRQYVTPSLEKQTTLSFPEKILERLNGGRFPRAIDLCSRCHHCR